ncbi:hypothetical protein Q8A73_009378 [Channa argus]|nr:hypothetical protein Q8A73_009378 [Channa argus]
MEIKEQIPKNGSGEEEAPLSRSDSLTSNHQQSFAGSEPLIRVSSDPLFIFHSGSCLIEHLRLCVCMDSARAKNGDAAVKIMVINNGHLRNEPCGPLWPLLIRDPRPSHPQPDAAVPPLCHLASMPGPVSTLPAIYALLRCFAF